MYNMYILNLILRYDFRKMYAKIRFFTEKNYLLSFFMTKNDIFSYRLNNKFNI